MPKSYLVTVYKDAAERYRWRLQAANGNILADSGQGYMDQYNAEQMARLLFGHLHARMAFGESA